MSIALRNYYYSLHNNQLDLNEMVADCRTPYIQDEMKQSQLIELLKSNQCSIDHLDQCINELELPNDIDTDDVLHDVKCSSINKINQNIKTLDIRETDYGENKTRLWIRTFTHFVGFIGASILLYKIRSVKMNQLTN